jgi:hypothetical protein
VRQHKPDINDLRTIIDLGDEAVFVAADIERGASTNWVGVREIPSGFSQIMPVRMLGDFPPVLQRLLRVCVLLPEFPQWPLADDMQAGAPPAIPMLSN